VNVELVSQFVEHFSELDFQVFQLVYQSRLVIAQLLPGVHFQRCFQVLELALNFHYPSLNLCAQSQFIYFLIIYLFRPS